ncbi:MAG: hypothetical protein IPF97_08155 [Sphingomonadales bacterium]|nr:hypothetical protein [Sphingomonadales bacterium]
MILAASSDGTGTHGSTVIRKLFNGQYPTARHKDDEIQSFPGVKARNDDAVLLLTKERTLTLGRGPG